MSGTSDQLKVHVLRELLDQIGAQLDCKLVKIKGIKSGSNLVPFCPPNSTIHTKGGFG